MYERITKYERRAQYSGGASHSSRNNSLHGHGGKQRHGRGMTPRNLPPVDGSCALKDEPEYPEQPPLRVGDRLINGLVKIIGKIREWDWVTDTHVWKFRVSVNGIIAYSWLTMREIFEWATKHFWKRCEAETDATPASASLKLLPSPRQTIAGLLPARVA